MLIGESFVGDGAEAAHVTTVLGASDGPVGAAWVTALATPRAGHASFLVVAQPGTACLPPTLFVNKAAVSGDGHARLTWGPAQAGVARGVGLAIEDGTIDREQVSRLVLVAAVWVDPRAADEGAVYENNTAATREALKRGAEGGPGLEEFLAASRSPFNPFFRPA
ncbi:MAG: formaldehyde-activating enzyme [Acidimicrobiales bacterium]